MLPTQLICLEAAYGYTTIATQRSEALGQEAEGYGSLIYSLKSNEAIQSLKDLNGKKIGVGNILAAGGFLLGWKVSCL